MNCHLTTFLAACWDRSARILDGFMQPVKEEWNLSCFIHTRFSSILCPDPESNFSTNNINIKNWQSIYYFLFACNEWMSTLEGALSSVVSLPHQFCLPVCKIWRYGSRHPVFRVFHWCWIGMFQHQIPCWKRLEVRSQKTSECFWKIWEKILGIHFSNNSRDEWWWIS